MPGFVYVLHQCPFLGFQDMVITGSDILAQERYLEEMIKNKATSSYRQSLLKIYRWLAIPVEN